MKLLAELGQEVYYCKDCQHWLQGGEGYSHEGHEVLTRISRSKSEVKEGSVIFECKRCGEDVTFEFIADDGTRMYSEENGVLVCQGFDMRDVINGIYRPVHTIKEVSE